MVSRWSARARLWGLIASCLVLVLVLGTEVGTDTYAYWARQTKGRTFGGDGNHLFFYDHTWAEFEAALAGLARQAPPGAVIATSSPHLAYLKTGGRAVMPPMEKDSEEAQRLLDSVPVAFVIVDELEFVNMARCYALPAVEAHPELWEQVNSDPGSHTRVYRRVRGQGPLRQAGTSGDTTH
jgi:hypothetical protein